MDASQEETEYKWFEAARFYEQKIKSESPSGILSAELWQKIGFCYDLASRQARDVLAHFYATENHFVGPGIGLQPL